MARGAISQNEYDESRLELERRVIEESIPEKQVEPTNQKAGVYTVFVLVLVVPFFAVAMWAATQHLGDFRLDGGINEAWWITTPVRLSARLAKCTTWIPH